MAEYIRDHDWPQIIEEDESDRDGPAVHTTRNQAADKATDCEERKAREDHGQKIVTFKIRVS